MSPGDVLLRERVDPGKHNDRDLEVGDGRPGEDPAAARGGLDPCDDTRERSGARGRGQPQTGPPGHARATSGPGGAQGNIQARGRDHQEGAQEG